MGIKSTSKAGSEEQSKNENSVDEINKKQKQAFEALDKEYEMARLTTHLNRGKLLFKLTTKG